MVIMKVVSDRLDSQNRPFIDLYLGWVYDKEVYLVRVRPQFHKDYKILLSQASEVKNVGLLENCVREAASPTTR